MKVWISEDEWYPVYIPEPDECGEMEVSDDLYQRWLRVEREFRDVQQLLKGAHDAV